MLVPRLGLRPEVPGQPRRPPMTPLGTHLGLPRPARDKSKPNTQAGNTTTRDAKNKNKTPSLEALSAMPQIHNCTRGVKHWMQGRHKCPARSADKKLWCTNLPCSPSSHQRTTGEREAGNTMGAHNAFAALSRTRPTKLHFLHS